MVNPAERYARATLGPGCDTRATLGQVTYALNP